MNILIYFGNQLSPTSGGTERVACLIADRLLEQGHTVRYLAATCTSSTDARPSSFLPDATDAPTINNIRFVKDFIDKYSINVIINEGASTDSVYLFSHEHIPQNIKLISHLHFNVRGDVDSFYRSQYLPILGINPIRSFINILKWIKMPYNRLQSLRNKRRRYSYMHRYSDKIIVLSPRQVDLLQNLIGVSASSKIEAIANPLTFTPDKSDYSAPKEPVALFVGRLEYGTKRVDRILKAWKIASPSMPQWSLKILGDGKDTMRLKKLSRQLSLKSVEFVGKTDSAKYYRNASLLLLSSNHEGTPMVIPEAMSYGVVPVVMNNFDDASLLIEDGYNGRLTPSFDISALACAIKLLANDDNSLRSMSANCLTTIANLRLRQDSLTRWCALING